MRTRILFVDDEQDICEVFALTLGQLGYDVTAVASASEALDKIEAFHFDVVLTDLGLPEMNGIRLCERILGARPDMPVVIVSGQNNVDTTICASRAGAYAFLVKPVDLEQLEKTVASAARHVQFGVRRSGTALRGADEAPL
jgi:two-component system response regulator HydG